MVSKDEVFKLGFLAVTAIFILSFIVIAYYDLFYSIYIFVVDVIYVIIDWITFNWKPIAQIIIIPGLAFTLLFAMIGVWFERKYLARAMLRIGPLYAGKVAGWLQLVADFLKLLTKEIVVPAEARRPLFYLMPVLIPTIPAMAIALIPFDSNWILFDVGGLGLLLFLTIMGILPLIPILVGWALSNKYTFIGSLRMAYMYISVGIPILLSVAGVAIYAGTYNLVEIVEAQSSTWFFIPQFLGFIVFFVALLAEVDRAPFDIPVAEQEIVFGWYTEYTGILFAFIMMSAYVALCAWSLMFITLYLGGFQGPVIFGSPLISHMVWVLIKLAVLTAVIMLLRTAFPRFKINQALKIGWNYLLPLSLANLVVTFIIKYLVV